MNKNKKREIMNLFRRLSQLKDGRNELEYRKYMFHFNNDEKIDKINEMISRTLEDIEKVAGRKPN